MFTAQYNVSFMWRWGEPCSSTATQRAVMIRLSLQGIVGDRLVADRLLPWDKSPPPPPTPFSQAPFHLAKLPCQPASDSLSSPLLSSPHLTSPPPSPPSSLSLLLEKGPFLVARNRTWNCHWFSQEYDDDYTITPWMSQCRAKRKEIQIEKVSSVSNWWC